MSIIKSYDDSTCKSYNKKLIFTNYKFQKVEKCGIRKLSKKERNLYLQVITVQFHHTNSKHNA